MAISETIPVSRNSMTPKIIVGILLLILGIGIIVAVVQGTGPDTTVQGTLEAYRVAVENQNYEDAYGYLDQVNNQYTLNEFKNEIQNEQLFGTTASQVKYTRTIDDNDATGAIDFASSLFGTIYEDIFRLVKINGHWKILDWTYKDLTPTP